MKKILVFLLMLSAGMTMLNAGPFQTIPAADRRFETSDCDIVRRSAADGSLRFERSLVHQNQRHLESPGARFRLRCNAKTLQIKLEFDLRPVKRSQNAVGVFLVDGKGKDQWFYERPKNTDQTTPEITIELPADGKMHDYEIVQPYAEALKIKSVVTDAETKFETPTARPGFRAVFFGDSVTHGFAASRIDRCYAFLIGEIKRWEVVNLGIGGIAATTQYADQIGKINMDLLVLALGVNDWQGGRDPRQTGKIVVDLVKKIRTLQPETPIAIVTPLWVPASWHPQSAQYPLAQYRSGIADAVNVANLKNVTVIDGTALIDHRNELFDPVAVHPNDAGFAQMARRLAEKLTRVVH